MYVCVQCNCIRMYTEVYIGKRKKMYPKSKIIVGIVSFYLLEFIPFYSICMLVGWMCGFTNCTYSCIGCVCAVYKAKTIRRKKNHIVVCIFNKIYN